MSKEICKIEKHANGQYVAFSNLKLIYTLEKAKKVLKIGERILITDSTKTMTDLNTEYLLGLACWEKRDARKDEGHGKISWMKIR